MEDKIINAIIQELESMSEDHKRKVLEIIKLLKIGWGDNS